MEHFLTEEGQEDVKKIIRNIKNFKSYWRLFRNVDVEYLMSIMPWLLDEKDRELFDNKYSEILDISKKDLNYIKNDIQSFIREKWNRWIIQTENSYTKKSLRN